MTTRQQIGAELVDDKHHVWLVRLKVEMLKPEEGNPPLYLGWIEVAGHLQLHPDIPAEDRRKLVFVNGGGLLYSAVREMVAMLTARSVHGMAELPTINPAVFMPNDESPASVREDTPPKSRKKKS